VIASGYYQGNPQQILNTARLMSNKSPMKL